MKTENLNFTEQELKEFLEYQRNQKLKQQLEAEPSTLERLQSWYITFRKSKHFNFLTLFLLNSIFAIACYLAPFWLQKHFPEMNPYLAEKSIRIGLASMVILSAYIFIDLKDYLLETTFYNYFRKNGNDAFDYQADFKNLTPWEKVLIVSLKRFITLFLFCLLVAL